MQIDHYFSPPPVIEILPVRCPLCNDSDHVAYSAPKEKRHGNNSRQTPLTCNQCMWDGEGARAASFQPPTATSHMPLLVLQRASLFSGNVIYKTDNTVLPNLYLKKKTTQSWSSRSTAQHRLVDGRHSGPCTDLISIEQQAKHTLHSRRSPARSEAACTIEDLRSSASAHGSSDPGPSGA